VYLIKLTRHVRTVERFSGVLNKQIMERLIQEIAFEKSEWERERDELISALLNKLLVNTLSTMLSRPITALTLLQADRVRGFRKGIMHGPRFSYQHSQDTLDDPTPTDDWVYETIDSINALGGVSSVEGIYCRVSLDQESPPWDALICTRIYHTIVELF